MTLGWFETKRSHAEHYYPDASAHVRYTDGGPHSQEFKALCGRWIRAINLVTSTFPVVCGTCADRIHTFNPEAQADRPDAAGETTG